MLKSIFKTDILHIVIALVFLTTPIESIGVLGEDSAFSIVKLVFLIFILVWFFKSRRFEVNEIISTLFLLFLYFLIGIIWSIDPETSVSKLLSFLFPSIFMCSIISYFLKRREDFLLIGFAYIIGCFIISYFALTMRAQVLEAALTGEMERVAAFGQDANEMAVLLNLGVGVLLHFMGSNLKLIAKILCWAVVIVFAFVIGSTGSRTGSIILIGLFLVYFINNKKSVPLVLPFILMAGVYLFQFFSDGIVERLLDTSSSIKSNDMTGRGLIWQLGWQDFHQENMLLGVGYANFSNMLLAHGHVGWASHNTYLSYLVNAGFLGILIFISLLYQIIKLAIKIYKLEKKWNMLYYILPLFVGMLTLETSLRRWLFLFSIVCYEYYILLKKETRKKIVLKS